MNLKFAESNSIIILCRDMSAERSDFMPEKKYFAASNSAYGFKSYYDSVFNIKKFAKIYIIKGGPGTGKSYFMKKAGERAESKGYSVTYIYCSSDPKSLDGIIIDELKLAMLDGTSPHAYDAKLPGAVEEIIDLGGFWKDQTLAGSRKIIESLSRQKSECFIRAYRYLSAVKDISQNIESLVKPYVKFEKIKKYVERIVKDVESGEGKEEYLLANSIGMEGKFRFDSYFENAGIYFEIHDFCDTGHMLLSELRSQLSEKRTDVMLSQNPVMPEYTDALATSPGHITFEINNSVRDGIRSINMKRFTDYSQMTLIRADIRSAMRMRDNVSELAVSEFEKAKKYHFTLEDIYGAAMDFDSKEEFCKEFIERVIA